MGYGEVVLGQSPDCQCVRGYSDRRVVGYKAVVIPGLSVLILVLLLGYSHGGRVLTVIYPPQCYTTAYTKGCGILYSIGL